MIKTVRLCQLMLLLLTVTGCALWGTPRFPLLGMNSDYARLVAQQQWLVNQHDRDYRLQAVIQIGDARWTLIFMDSLGQRLATLVRDQAGLDVQVHESHALNGHWTTLAQSLQFIYWPLADLQQQGAEGWNFATGEGVRQVYFSGILAGHVDYLDANPWQGTVRYTNNKSDLRLVIESRQLQSQKR